MVPARVRVGRLLTDEAAVGRLTEIAVDAGYPTAGAEGYTRVDSRVAGAG